MTITESSDKVTINFKYSTFEKELTIINRYFVYSENRWDIVLNELERYCVENGLRGCFINSSICNDIRNDKRYKGQRNELNRIWIIDMAKVFTKVNFIENDYKEDVFNEYNSPTIKWYDGTDDI